MRKNNKKKLAIFFVVILAPLCFTSFTIIPVQARKSNSSYNPPPPTMTVADLEVGDVIMYPDGGSLISKIIPGDYVHSAIYIGNGKIIEANENGVIISSVPTTGKLVLRVRTSASKKQAAVNFAMTKMGLPYDFIWLTYIGDKDVNGGAYYCSELCWAAYKSQGVDIDRNPRWSWTYGRNVAPQELVDDGDTQSIGWL